MITKIKGNLLDARAEAIVNTVNSVGVMGKGIALQFRKAFPDNYKAYKKACAAGEVVPGKMFIYDLGGIQNPRYIINFPTKRHWRGASRIEDIKAGLQSLTEDVRRLAIRSIALPPLGCGSGRLNWNEVYALITDAFSKLPQVQVTVFEPAGSPPAEAMADRTQRPGMSFWRAAILGLMKRYCIPGFGYRLSLLEIHKLTYFLIVSGETNEPMTFAKGRHGPYADTLRHVLERMDGHFITGYGDGKNAPELPIDFKPEAAIEAEQFLHGFADTKQRIERVAQLIEGFETSYGMELLASVHWVATQQNASAQHDVEAAVADVHAWNEKKRRIPADHIRRAWQRLRDQGWL